MALFTLLISFLISQWIHSPLKKNGIKIYYADNISAAHQQIVEKFNDIHKGRIEVVTVDLPFSKFSTNERKELLARALRSQSDRLDVYAVDVIWVPRFTKWSEPLEKYFPDLKENDLIPGVLNTAIYDSTLMAIPLYTDLMHLYYRKDLLEQLPDNEVFIEKLNAGITWAELIEYAQKNRERYPDFFVFPGKNFEGLMCMFYANLYSQDYSFSANNISIGQTKEASKAIETLYNLIFKYKISPLEVAYMDEYEGYLYSLEKDAVIFVGWPGLLEQQKKNLSDRGILDKIAMAPLPRFSTGKTVSIYGGWNLMISKNSKNKEAAAEFIKFISTEENQKFLCQVGGYIPVHIKLFKDPDCLSSKEKLKFYNKISVFGKSRPLHENYTQISDIYSHFINLAIKGEISAKEALEKATQELTSLHISAE